jgi:hypothetical protein
MRWFRRRLLNGMLVFWALVLLSPLSAAAQDAGGGFVAASVVLSSGFKATEDPEGSGYLHTTYAGALDWPAVGARINGGGFLARHWSLGGELAFRQPRTTTVTSGSFTHSESTAGSAHYANREQLLSIVVRRHSRGRLGVEPFGGLTMARTTRELTNRRAVYRWPGGSIEQLPADVSVTEWSRGVLGGVEVAVRADSGLTFVSGVRLHWLPGRQESEYADNHVGLRSPEYVWQIGAGVIWRLPRH